MIICVEALHKSGATTTPLPLTTTNVIDTIPTATSFNNY
jgi:hypothetical protein